MSRSSPPATIFLVSLIAAASASAAAPVAPSDLTATSVTSEELTLRWTDNSNNETGFEIQYRFDEAGEYILLGRVLANTHELPLSVTGNITYQFRVRAYLAPQPLEYSAFAGPVTVTTPGVTSSKASFGLLGKPYEFQIVSNQPTLATTYAINALPPGLSLNPATGLISGTPTTLGKAVGNITIQHSNGTVATGSLTLCINKPVPVLAGPVTSVPLPHLNLTLGGPPSTVPLSGSFTDPDVGSAVRLVTDSGTADFVLFPESAPQTVANFLGYASRGDFANTIFHRHVNNFVVQGGGYRADATASSVPTQSPVMNEPAITNALGTVAMAKIAGSPNSATNQFFVNLADNSTILNDQNEGFTVFARVAGNGMNLFNAIAGLPKANYSSVNGALTDTPVRITPAPAVYDPANLVRISSVTPISPLGFTATAPAPAVASAAVTGTDLTVTPVGPGTTTLAITATDLDGQTVTSDLLVTVLDTYETWAARQGFANPEDGAASADPDHDGLTNSEEFALATGPLSPTTANPAGRISNSHLEIAFTLNTWAAGTLVTVQSATDLAGPWTDQWKSSDGFSHPWIGGSTLANGVASLVVRDPATLPAPTTSRKFLRLKFN